MMNTRKVNLINGDDAKMEWREMPGSKILPDEASEVVLQR